MTEDKKISQKKIEEMRRKLYNKYDHKDLPKSSDNNKDSYKEKVHKLKNQHEKKSDNNQFEFKRGFDFRMFFKSVGISFLIYIVLFGLIIFLFFLR